MKPQIWIAAAALLLIFSTAIVARSIHQDYYGWPLLIAGLAVYVACLILAKKSK